MNMKIKKPITIIVDHNPNRELIDGVLDFSIHRLLQKKPLMRGAIKIKRVLGDKKL